MYAEIQSTGRVIILADDALTELADLGGTIEADDDLGRIGAAAAMLTAAGYYVQSVWTAHDTVWRVEVSPAPVVHVGHRPGEPSRGTCPTCDEREPAPEPPAMTERAAIAETALSASVHDVADLSALPVFIVGADLVRLLADFGELNALAGSGATRAEIESAAVSIAAARGYLPPVGVIGTVSA